MAAPPLTPPERQNQLLARSTGVACSAAATTIVFQRNLKMHFKAVVVVLAYLFGELATRAILALTTSAKGQEEEPSSQTSAGSIWVDDVEQEKIVRERKPIAEKIFFWRKKRPQPEVESPTAPAWSNVQQEKETYKEDYGI